MFKLRQQMAVHFLALFLLASFGTLKANEKVMTKALKDAKAGRNRNIAVLYAIPDEDDEVVMDLVAAAGRKLGFEKNPLEGVVTAYRSKVPKFLIPKPIVVFMVNQTMVHKWTAAFEEKKLHDGTWHILAGLPTDQVVLKEEVEEWAKEREFPDVWFDENNTVLYRKEDSSPDIYKVVDQDHLHRLMKDDQRHQVTWDPTKS